MIGWIKLHRKLKDWQWYDDHNATRLLIHLLVSVNYEDKKWKGILIKSGSMVTSWEHLSKDCGLSLRQTRTSMSKLESSGEVTRKVTNKFQLITLLKWEELQSNDNQVTAELTDGRQTNDKLSTTTKEHKEIKEVKENNIDSRKQKFATTLKEFSNIYSRDMLKEFYAYWTEPNKSNTKFRQELEKTWDIKTRLNNWSKNDKTFKSNKPQPEKKSLGI